jgi:hypothetical protein
LTVKQPLSERGIKAVKVENPQFSKNRIVWKYGEPSVFPSSLSDDPFASALIKYFNSLYFHTEVKDTSAISKYRIAVELYIKVMVSVELTVTPENIYAVFDAYLREQMDSYYQEYRVYTCFRSPARKVSSVRIKSRRQRNLGLLRNIDLTESERLALSIANKFAPNKKPPEKGEKSAATQANDLYEHLNIQDVDAQALIESIRAFSAFFVCEWGRIRDSIYSCFPETISYQLARAQKLPTNTEGCMSSNKILSMETESKEFFSAQFCFDMVKEINNPLLTERFVLDYLAVNSGKDSRCEIAKNVWNWAEKRSTSGDYDWIEVIERQYSGKHNKNTICHAEYSGYNTLGSKKAYPNTDPEYVGILGGVFPARKILGLSISEQVCMAWIMATDRHQPSNMRWMTVGDLVITDNSISTIIDIHTLKQRASVTSGTPYDELDTIFTEGSGATYKRTQSIFNALNTYRKQVIRSAAQGLSQRNNKGGEKDLWFFHDIRSANRKEPKDGYIENRYAKFNYGNDTNIELAICAMAGSLSNNYVLSKCPEARIFLSQIAKIYAANPHRKIDPKTGKSHNTFLGIKGMGWHYISKTAVYQKISNRYSSSEITISENNNIEVDDRESQLATDRDAALAFHGKATRNTVYADKLPAYLTDRNDFGARVGDEWIRLARELSGKRYDNSSVMTLADVRRLLGLKTTAESEVEQLNELLGAVEQEEMSLDELGLISNNDGKVFIVRHPIVISNIQNQIKVIEQQLDKLEYSNEKRMRKAVTKYMYLKMILKEKFTPSEIKESEDLYGDVEFPVGDILI